MTQLLHLEDDGRVQLIYVAMKQHCLERTGGICDADDFHPSHYEAVWDGIGKWRW